MRDKVNRVKGREMWRPLAPSVAARSYAVFFSSGRPSQFMLRAEQVLPAVRTLLAGVTHVDGTARPQSVEATTNPRFAALLDAWERRTGLPVLLNTSFNLAGEPIVHSPADAISSFLRSDIDRLVIGDFVLSKPSGPDI